jgi:hypothetical protein
MHGVSIIVGKGTHLGTAPMHRGHHSIWAAERFQADICNQVDDLVIGDRQARTVVRFPITHDLWPSLEALIRHMDDYDGLSRSPWQLHNANVRLRVMRAAERRLDGTPPHLAIFEPGLVGPALAGMPMAVDSMIARMLTEHPEATAPAGATPLA